MNFVVDKKVKNYIIVMRTNANDQSMAVEAMLNEGFELYGNPFIATADWFGQAMIKSDIDFEW